MGGKNKQRTKGNTRPSSSGRAADLLARESGTIPGFIGFGSSQSDHGYVPAVQGAEEVDSLVDADFRMVLRKLNKRDATTKLKAMQEFGAMCKERDVEAVQRVLPYWTRVYCKMSMDHERRVREATQQAFLQLILKVQKNLAPHLKAVMGHWLIAQCDTHAPSASAAKTAFDAAFPAAKQVEALAFCQADILTLLNEHLIKATPDTLSDPKTVPVEERESKYIRVLISSLLALKLLVSSSPKSTTDYMQEQLESLVSQGKFWKLCKHKTPLVRSVFFQLISAFCQHLRELLKPAVCHLSPAVFLSIDDNDPVVCPALWDALLYTASTMQDCWNHVNIMKGFFPKFWVALRGGGWGVANTTFICLLPFITIIPQRVKDPEVEFYRNFFESMRIGMSSERAVVSSAERDAIVSAFMECLRFAMEDKSLSREELQKTQHMLITDQLIPLIDSAFKDSKLKTTTLFYDVNNTLYGWEKRTASSDDEAPDTRAQEVILSEFWNDLEHICVAQVDAVEAGEGALDAVSTFLKILLKEKYLLKAGKPKKKLHVQFADEEEKRSENEEPDMPNVQPAASDPFSCMHLRTERLNKLVCILAERSMGYIHDRGSRRHMKFLAALLIAFPSVQVYQVIIDRSRDPETEHVERSHGNAAIKFVYETLIDWLKTMNVEEADFLVDILYSVLYCSTDSERHELLEDLTKMDLKWSVFLQIIQRARSDKAKHSLVHGWLKGNVLGDKLLRLAVDLCSDGLTNADSYCSKNWSLLSLVLSEQTQNESLIGTVYVEKIIDQLHSALAKASDLSKAGDIEQSVSFICDVASNFFSSVEDCLQMESADDLLLTIFQLCAQVLDAGHLSESLLQKLKDTWLSGLNSLVRQFAKKPQQNTFLSRSAKWVGDRIQNSNLDVQSLYSLICAVNDLHCKILEAGPSAFHLLEDHMLLMVPSEEKWQEMRDCLSTQWLDKPLLEGRLSMNTDTSSTGLKPVSKSRLPSHLCTSSLLTKMVFRKLENDELFKEQETGMKMNVVVAEMLYSLQWCEELSSQPAFITEWSEMLPTLEMSLENIMHLSDVLPLLLELLYNRSKEGGKLWSLTIYSFLPKKGVGTHELSTLVGTTEGFFPVTLGNLHTLQCCSPFFDKALKEDLATECIDRLLSCTAPAVSSTDGDFGYLAIINSCLQSGHVFPSKVINGVFKVLLSWKVDFDELFLFDCTLQEASPSLIGLNIEMIKFFSLLLKQATLSSLTNNEWDFIMCSTMAWLETVSESSGVYHVPLVQLFACSSCNLASGLSGYFQEVSTRNAENIPANILSDWDNFFSEGIHGLLLPMLVKLTGEYKGAEASHLSSVLKSLGEALHYITKEQLQNHLLPAKFVAGQSTNLPDALQTLLNTLAPLLLYRDSSVQISVFHMLEKIMPDLPMFEDLKYDDDDEPVVSPPAALMAVLTIQEELVERILEGVPVGEFVLIDPLKEEFCYVLGYLLNWKLILTFFKAASSQLRAHYALYIRKTKSLSKLLCSLFKLMPHTPVVDNDNNEYSKDTKTFFTEELNLAVKGTSALHNEIPHLACCVYLITLKDLPAMVRLWWNSCDKRVFSIVDKFTTKYVSGVLSSQEIISVQSSTHVFDGMTVKARSATREVIATYSIDDICIELIIQLPQNYPLGSITVESGSRVGVAVQQWRNWMLQLNTYLTHQNGSIMDGLSLWKNNVDKRFEGVEDCMICFSVIHGSNYSLPKKACRTCKKKFHSECLYKWFTSSNKSTCPLCRETFF